MKRCLGCGYVFEDPEWGCRRCSWQPPVREGYRAFAPAVADQNDGFEATFFGELAALEENHFWFESRNRILIWALRTYFGKAASFLEIGCGTGYVLKGIRAACPALRLAGSEIFTRGLAFASSRLPDVELFQMDARAIPFEREFDVIGAFDVVEHIDEDQTVLRELYRAVKPGGGILLTVPQHRFLWSRIDEFSCHKRRYSKTDLARKVTAAGFRVVHVTSFVSLLLPVLVLSRFRRKWTVNGAYDPRAELKIAPALNRSMLKVMDVERRVLERQISLPAGGSLLLVAKRD
jgi:SAM-dependent methyltransferase